MGKPSLTSEQEEVLRAVSAQIDDPKAGLPDPVFQFALSVVPMINVDLLVLDDQGRVLLAWRDDQHFRGWHVPGGIIRGREPLEERIANVARDEIGAAISASDAPVAIAQLFGGRGHFISLVYACRAVTPPTLAPDAGRRHPGDLWWFDEPPLDTYPPHDFYRLLTAELRRDPSPRAPRVFEAHFEPDESGPGEGAHKMPTLRLK